MIGISTCVDPYTPMVYVQFIMMGVSRCVDPHTHMLAGLLRAAANIPNCAPESGILFDRLH